MNNASSHPQAPPASHDVHSTVRTVSLGTVWRALRYPFILLSVALIPRLMGDTDYGRYAYFVSVFVLLDMLTDLGFLQIFGRFVPECRAAGDEQRLGALFWGLLTYGVMLAAWLVAVVGILNLVRTGAGWSWTQFAFLAALLILTRIEGTFFSFLYGLNQIARFSAKEAVRSAATLLLVLVLYRAWSLPGAWMALVLNEVLLTGLGACWIRPHLRMPVGAPRWRDLKPYALFGIRFYVPALLFGMLQRMGNVWTQWWTGSSEQVAYYDIANQYLLLTATFLGLILQTLLPALTHLHLQSDQETVRRWQRVALTYCGITAFLAFNALMWFGELFIEHWLGASFLPALPNAKILTLAMAPVLLAYAGMNYALLEKSARVYLTGVALGLLVMTLISSWAIPTYKSMGAAWATVAGYVVLAWVFVARYWTEFRHMISGLVATVALGAVFYLFYTAPPSWVSAMGRFLLTSVLYIGIMMGLRFIRCSDVRKVWAAFQSRPS